MLARAHRGNIVCTAVGTLKETGYMQMRCVCSLCSALGNTVRALRHVHDYCTGSRAVVVPTVRVQAAQVLPSLKSVQPYIVQW